MPDTRNQKLSRLRTTKVYLETLESPSSTDLLLLKSTNREILDILDEDRA
jgi:hypothetical protein